LAAGLGIATLAAAAGYLAARLAPAAAPLRYRQITFRRGQVLGSRFAPDQQSVVYAAQWERDPRQIFITNPASPEARSLGFSDLTLGAISRRGELALLRTSGIMNISGGTLSRVPINGGASQVVGQNITAVDWSADGARLAVVRAVDGSQQLEFPLGHVLYKAAGWLSGMRLAPSNDAIAFIEHPGRHDDAGSVKMVSAGGRISVLSEGWVSAAGLAWNPRGDEVWFTAARENAPRSLWAVSRTRKLRGRVAGSWSAIANETSRPTGGHCSRGRRGAWKWRDTFRVKQPNEAFPGWIGRACRNCRRAAVCCYSMKAARGPARMRSFTCAIPARVRRSGWARASRKGWLRVENRRCC